MILDTMLRDELRKLNAHLPKTRKTVRELLDEESPSVSTVGGGRIAMKKTEIEELSSVLDDNLRDKVKLPIVLLRSRELGPGAFKLLGDSSEEHALNKVLRQGSDDSSGQDAARNQGIVFYKPEVSELKRRFHSLVVIGFGLAD